MPSETAKFVSERSLYEKIALDPKWKLRIHDWLSGQIRFDCYCMDCERESVFVTKWTAPLYGRSAADAASSFLTLPFKSHGTFEVACTCMRSEGHTIYVMCWIDRKFLVKVGQYPSVADLSFATISSFRKVLSPIGLRELKTAIGLASHGVGIGSFVYLRRIVEQLIEYHKAAAMQEGRSFHDWNSKRVNEKIECLSDYLPSLLISNKRVYGILSKGIHELDEETCKSYFPVLREVVFMILRADETRRREKEQEQALQKALQQIEATPT